MTAWLYADALVDALGVNTHFNQSGTTYTSNNSQTTNASIASCVNLLAAIGVRHVRDTYANGAAGDGSSTSVAVADLAAASVAGSPSGIDICWAVVPGGTSAATNFGSSTSGHFSNFLNSGYPTPLAAETINEQDGNSPSTYISDLVGLQPGFYTAMQSKWPGAVVLAPSMATPTDSENFDPTAHPANDIHASCQRGNIHTYTFSQPGSSSGGGFYAPGNATGGINGSWNGGNFGTIGSWNGVGTHIVPGVNHWITETGVPNYHTIENNGALTDERAGALYAVHAWLYASGILGCEKVFLYDGIDDHLTASSMQDRFGHLARGDLTYKTGGTAIANMIALLADNGQRSFTVNQIPVTVAGNTTNLLWLLAQKKNGDCYFIGWVNKTFCTSVAGVGYGTGPYQYPAGPNITQPPQTVTVTLDASFAGVEVHTPVDDANITTPSKMFAGNSFMFTPSESPVVARFVARGTAGTIGYPTLGRILANRNQ